MIGLIFDFDGPLYDGRSGMKRALNETYEQFGKITPFDVPDIGSPPLYGPKRLIDLLFSKADLSSAELAKICEYYANRLREIEAETGITAEIQDIIRKLSDAGIPLAILSSRPVAEIQAHLDRAEIARCFRLVLGRDNHPTPKPDPAGIKFIVERFSLSPSQVAMIGDTDHDFQAASGAGIAYYHAGWTGEPSADAYRKATAVLESGADYHLFLSCTESPGAIEPAVLPGDLRTSIADREFCFFAGAGVSIPSGLGAWTEHYKPLLRALNATLLTQDHDLPETLQLVASDETRSREVFNRFQHSFEDVAAKPNGYHFALIRSGAIRIWTTNYDHLFEDALSLLGSPHVLVSSDSELLKAFGDSSHKSIVIKMHGDFRHAVFQPNLDWGLVFLEEQFDLAERNRREILRLLEDDYRNNAIIFVGISFQDPALRRVLATAAKGIPKSRHKHYLLMKSPSHPLEIYTFKLYRENLRRRNIETLFFQDFVGIERFVRQMAIASNRPIVGFSGTTEPPAGKPDDSKRKLPGAQLDVSQIEKLCGAVGRALAERGFRVTSGHGPGVGVPSVEEAFKHDPTRARFYLRRRGTSVFSRTAPAVVVPGESLETMRERFISELDLLVAVGGKTVNEKTPGTIAEIELALSKQIPVLLVPQAGGDVLDFNGKFYERLETAFSDVELYRCLIEANRTIATLGVQELLEFADTGFAALIEDVVAKSLASGTPRQSDGLPWNGADAW